MQLAANVSLWLCGTCSASPMRAHLPSPYFCTSKPSPPPFPSCRQGQARLWQMVPSISDTIMKHEVLHSAYSP